LIRKQAVQIIDRSEWHDELNAGCSMDSSSGECYNHMAGRETESLKSRL